MTYPTISAMFESTQLPATSAVIAVASADTAPLRILSAIAEAFSITSFTMKAKATTVLLVDLTARLGRMPVVVASITVKRTEQASRGNHVLYTPEATGRAFLVDEEHGVVLAGRVVHGDDQVPLLSGHPFVGAAVLMDHHAR